MENNRNQEIPELVLILQTLIIIRHVYKVIIADFDSTKQVKVCYFVLINSTIELI